MIMSDNVIFEETTKKVDVYSYAIVLYEIITGIPAWDKIKKMQLRVSILSGKRPEFPNSLKEEFSQIKEIIQKCWAQNPVDRPTFTEILHQLQ